MTNLRFIDILIDGVNVKHLCSSPVVSPKMLKRIKKNLKKEIKKT